MWTTSSAFWSLSPRHLGFRLGGPFVLSWGADELAQSCFCPPDLDRLGTGSRMSDCRHGASQKAAASYTSSYRPVKLCPAAPEPHWQAIVAQNSGPRWCPCILRRQPCSVSPVAVQAGSRSAYHCQRRSPFCPAGLQAHSGGHLFPFPPTVDSGYCGSCTACFLPLIRRCIFRSSATTPLATLPHGRASPWLVAYAMSCPASACGSASGTSRYTSITCQVFLTPLRTA